MSGRRGARRRHVVTGIGAVSACGWGAGALWRVLHSGRTAIAPARRFDVAGQRTRVAAEVPEPPPEVVRAVDDWDCLSQADRFAVAAADEACRQAGVEAGDPGLGVFFATSTAGMAEAEEFFRLLAGKRPAGLRRLRSQQINGPGDAVARRLAVTGPVYTVSSACASGALAVAEALEALRAGEVEVAVAGGADSLCALTYSGFNALRAVDESPCRPFRGERAGLSLGEGAGVLVLESLERALQRGATVLAEVVGAGASCDAHHMTAPHPRGDGACLAMKQALADAELEPASVGFVNAHGTGTPLNDVSEWRAIEQVFDGLAPRVPVTSTKGAVGHLLGASGAIEAVATVQCLLAGEIHPTPGDGEVDAELEVDLVRQPRSLPAERPVALSTSFAFGGANAALALAAAAGPTPPDAAVTPPPAESRGGR